MRWAESPERLPSYSRKLVVNRRAVVSASGLSFTSKRNIREFYSSHAESQEELGRAGKRAEMYVEGEVSWVFHSQATSSRHNRGSSGTLTVLPKVQSWRLSMYTAIHRSQGEAVGLVANSQQHKSRELLTQTAVAASWTRFGNNSMSGWASSKKGSGKNSESHREQFVEQTRGCE